MGRDLDGEMFKFTPDISKAIEELCEVNKELGTRMKEELSCAARGEENILLIGSNGELMVTILHVSPDFMAAEQEMILLPTSSSIAVLAAVSREYLELRIRKCEDLVWNGDGALADEAWNDLMGELMERALTMNKIDPCTF